jgi:hypothetical protein
MVASSIRKKEFWWGLADAPKKSVFGENFKGRCERISLYEIDTGRACHQRRVDFSASRSTS